MGQPRRTDCRTGRDHTSVGIYSSGDCLRYRGYLPGCLPLLGSINAALLVAWSCGVDIRAVGSGNPGASNVLRTIGKGQAAVVYLFDLVKGFVPCVIGMAIWGPSVSALVGLCAVIGHCYPLYFRFRGGKGVATAGGVALAVAPPFAVIIMVVVYGVAVRLTRISAVGSLAAVVLAVPAMWLTGADTQVMGWFGLAMVLIVFRHRSNLVRLLAGIENRFT